MLIETNDMLGQQALARFFTPLLQPASWEALRLGAQRAYVQLGVAGFMLRYQAVEGGTGVSVGSLPEALLRAFCRQTGDPVDVGLARSPLPQSWRSDVLAYSYPHALYGQLGDAGVGFGLSVACRSGAGISRVDFYRGPDGVSFTGCAQQGALQLLALHLHEGAAFVQRSASALSDREREALAWSARGKSIREASDMMGISQRAVYFHLQNAAAKLQVYSTRHAVSRAIELGLIPA
jgi:DNA-binding CsgD family transcriptional regulator